MGKDNRVKEILTRYQETSFTKPMRTSAATVQKIFTHHYHLLVVSEDFVAVDHTDDGHAQVTSDSKGDAEANARENGDDVASGQTKARAVHHGHLLLLHLLRPTLRRQLDGLAILLLLLKNSGEKKERLCRVNLTTTKNTTPADYT